MSAHLLLCTDLDRTLLPNGDAPESPGSRERFATLAARPEVSLAYVSGRHRELVDEGLREYALPHPDFLITDVGSTIHRFEGKEWRLWPGWRARLSDSWNGARAEQLAPALAGIDELQLQEADRQGEFKLSYTVPLDTPPMALMERVRERLAERKLPLRLVWSVDPAAGCGLLDILPEAAGKLGSIRHLMEVEGTPAERVVFAGDSGNDLDVLCSEIPAILVANADESVRQRAVDESAATGHASRLYLARGGFQGLNGNYAAGILEGLAHYLPETAAWLS